MAGCLVARWFFGGEMVGGEIPWWRDDRIPLDCSKGQRTAEKLAQENYSLHNEIQGW